MAFDQIEFCKMGFSENKIINEDQQSCEGAVSFLCEQAGNRGYLHESDGKRVLDSLEYY